MAFYKQDIVDINLNTGNIHRSFLNHAIGYKNDDADRFGIRTFRDGVPQDLTGASCQAVFMAPNGSKIALTSYGTVSGNVAYVTLPPACYDYEGQFCLAIQLVGGGVTGTMRIVDGMVVNTGASGTVAPTSSVPTYQEIIAQYDAMVAATAAANGAIAATYSGSATYKVGDYCIHDGGLYRCTTAITTAEAWNAAHWTATKIGPDVSDLKSALSEPSWNQFGVKADGESTNNGITYTLIEETGLLKLSGSTSGSSSSSNWFFGAYLQALNLTNGETVTFSVSVKSGTISGGSVYLSLSGQSETALTIGKINKRTFEYNSSNHNKIQFYIESNTTIADLYLEIQLEKGSKASPYRRYGEPVANDIKARYDISNTEGEIAEKANTAWFKERKYDNSVLTIQNYYINTTNGNATSSNGSYCTDFIEIKNVQSIVCVTGINNSACAIAFYDKDKIFLPTIKVVGDGAKTYSVDLTQNDYESAAYVRISCYGTYNFNHFLCKFPAYYTDIVNSKANSEWFNLNILDQSCLSKTDYLIDPSTGEDSAYSGAYASDFIPLDGIVRIDCYTSMSASGCTIAFYGEAHEYLRSISIVGSGAGINNALKNYIADITQSGFELAKYIRVSCYGSTNKLYFYCRLTTHSEKIVDIKSVHLIGKTIDVLGDSISSLSYNRPCWWEQIAKRTGAIIRNYGVSGSSFAIRTGRTDSFVERVSTLDQTADAVFVMGGTNDNDLPIGAWGSTDTGTFYGALNYVMQYLLNNFQGKPIIFATMIQPKGAYETNVSNALELLNALSETDVLNRELRAEAIKAKCHQYGIPCLDLFSGSGISGVNGAYYLPDDNLHPSALGQFRLSTLIQNEWERFFA